MCARTQNWSSHKLIHHIDELEMTRPYVSTSVVPDGARLYKAMQRLKQGHPVEETVKIFGDKLVARATRLNDKISNKLAYLGRKSAARCGFIGLKPIMDTTGDPRLINEVIGYNVVLTLKGERVVADYHNWAIKTMVDDVAAEYTEKYKQQLLHNVALWVRTDRRPIKQDVGMELYTALIKPIQQGDFNAAVEAAKKFLFASEDKQDVKDAIEEVESMMQDMYPIIDGNLTTQMDELSELEDGIDSLEHDEENLVEKYTGGSMVTEDPTIRDRFLQKLDNAVNSKMNIMELWDNVLMPMVDHFTSKAYGPNVGVVDLGQTESEKEATRADFPYDPNITIEHWYKNLPVKTVDLGHAEDGRWKGRQIIQRRELRTSEFNQEDSADFQLNKVYERVEDLKDWKKKLVLCTMAAPIGKNHLDTVGYKKITDDHYLLVIKARYIRDNGPDADLEGREFKRFAQRCQFYYSW